MRTIVVTAVLCVAWAACNTKKTPTATSDQASRGPLGTERADCRPGDDGGVGTCDVGLLCLSNVCVRPPPADCKAVGERLTSMELGNYAPVEERKPVVEKYTATCEEARVSKEEGECLKTAKSKWAAARCVPRLFPELTSGDSGDCQEITNKLFSYLAEDMGGAPDAQEMMQRVVAAFQASCEEDGWPDAFKRCILESAGKEGLDGCEDSLPEDLQQRIQERIQRAMP